MPTLPILAVDGGGTSCRAALCLLSGEIIAYSEQGACNYQNVGVKQVKQTLSQLFKKLQAQYNPSETLHIQSAVIGVAGIDTPRDLATIQKLFNETLESCKITVDDLIIKNDAMMTLYGISGDGPGLLVIAGTGSIVCGKDDKDQEVRVGGWGHKIGDEGSGYAIGQAAVKHVFKSYDGEEPPSKIGPAILKKLNLETIHELMDWIYQPDFTVEQMASLAPLIFDLANQGDVKAIAILKMAGHDLVSACRTAIDRLNIANQSFTLSFAGGILQKQPYVAEFMKQELAQEFNFSMKTLSESPIFYNLYYGLQLLDSLNDETEERCRATLASWK